MGAPALASDDIYVYESIFFNFFELSVADTVHKKSIAVAARNGLPCP